MMAGEQITDAGAGGCQDSKLFTQRAVKADGKFTIVAVLTWRLITLRYGSVLEDRWIRERILRRRNKSDSFPVR
jgi:hypothetical protein